MYIDFIKDDIIELCKNKKKITLVGMNEFGFLFSINLNLDRIEIRDYAQYKNSIFFIGKPKRKQKLRSYKFNPNQYFIIFDGWVDVDTEMYRSENKNDDFTIKKSLRCFDKEYFQIALNSINIKPLYTNFK